MLKKLRLRFVCVLMAIVTVTLCLMFGLVYHFTRENLESQALSMMESVVEDPLQLVPGDEAALFPHQGQRSRGAGGGVRRLLRSVR